MVGQLFDWTDKNVVIFNADNMIGSTISHAFAYYQANVVLVDKNTDSLQNMHEIIKRMGNKSLIYGINVSDNEQITTMIQDILEKLGTIDVLVNLCRSNSLPLIKEIGNVMKAQRYGKIINTVSDFLLSHHKSIVSQTELENQVIEFTQLLAREYISFGVNVNGICRAKHAQSPTVHDEHIGHSDIVGAYLFLGSSGADFITGQTLFVHNLSFTKDQEIG